MMNFKLYLSGVEHRSGASNGGQDEVEFRENQNVSCAQL